MGFCGDAVKIKNGELESLLELQSTLLANRKLELDAREIKEDLQRDSIREQMLELSSKLSSARTNHEELEREKRRVLDEHALVSKRLQSDLERLKTTAVPRDAISLQHEVETLRKRLQALDETQLGIEGELEISSMQQHNLQVERDSLEQAVEEHREAAKFALESLKSDHAKNSAMAQRLRDSISSELLERFDRLFARGNAVGRLKSTSCGACNMNLTSSALAQIHQVAADEAATCPECQAFLVR